MTQSLSPKSANALIDHRIAFHEKTQIMEADFSGLSFETSEYVNHVFDRVEDRIRETGEPQWFFLVNYSGCSIDPSAWVAFSRRGKSLNLAHSMGTVRVDASETTRRQIERAANTEAFDPNLFMDRETALARLAELPSKRRARVQHDANYAPADFARRIHFDRETQIMEVDFSYFTFHHARDVDDFYDFVEERIKETDLRWFFLVDLNGCEILPAAWVRYAYRGKRLNKAASLGTARFAAGSETEADIRLRAESSGFRPNIRNTRAEAVALITEMRRKLSHS